MNKVSYDVIFKIGNKTYYGYIKTCDKDYKPPKAQIEHYRRIFNDAKTK